MFPSFQWTLNLMCTASSFEELYAAVFSLWPWPNHLPLSRQQTELMCSSWWLISLVFDDLVTKAYVSVRFTSSSSSSSSSMLCLYHLSLTTPFSLNRQIEQVFTVGPKSNSSKGCHWCERMPAWRREQSRKEQKIREKWAKKKKCRDEKRVIRKWNCLLTEVDREAMEEVEEQWR